MEGPVAPRHISWEARVPVEGHPDSLLPIDRRELREISCQTAAASIEEMAAGFSLSNRVVDGMWAALDDVNIMMVDGHDAREYSEANPARLFIGPATLAIASTLSDEAAETRPSRTVYLSMRSINAEIANLTTARSDLGLLMRENPDLVTSNSHSRLIELQDNDNCKQTAIALSFARRLLKYGLLPDDVLPKGLQVNYGFAEWLDFCKSKSDTDRVFSSSERKMLAKVYERDGMAIKNLRRAVWGEIFYRIVGIDPQRDSIFYMHYFTPALGENSDYTMTFHESRTCNIRQAATTDCLQAIFDPSGTPLRAV